MADVADKTIHMGYVVWTHFTVGCLLGCILGWTFGFAENGYGNAPDVPSTTQMRFFSWHPLLNVLAFGVAMTEAILTYRFWTFSKQTNKLIHAGVNGVAFVFSLAAFIIVVKYHNDNGFANFQSVHSWVGVAVLVLLWIQFVGSIFVYLIPGIPSLPLRAALLPYHRINGLIVYGGAMVATVSGLMEKQSFTKTAGGLKAFDVITNITAICTLVVGASVVLALNPIRKAISRNEQAILRNEEGYTS